MPASPADIIMPPGSSMWPESVREQLAGTLTPAGVLVPIMNHESELTVLLTQRSAALKHHAGQVSFPGGRKEAYDLTLEETALRETREEVGILPDCVSVLGYLNTMPTITGYAVTPVVGMVASDASLAVDHNEVEYTFEVPLSYLLDPANDVYAERLWHGRKMSMVEFHWQGERIWGATAFMILSLREILYKQ